MSELPFSCDKLLVGDPQKSRSTCHIFISHQSLAEEKSLGKLFLVAEIRSGDTINSEIINTIQEEIKASYFNTDDLNIETAFEKALERTNQRIADMIGDYDTNWLDRFNAIIAVIKGDALHLSSIGVLPVFLVRNHRITNIIQATTDHDTLAERVNPLKAFSHIISGSLEPDDALFFCTPSLLDYLSQEKLKRTIVDYNAHQAITSLERLLVEDTSNATFAALLIKFEPEKIFTAAGTRLQEKDTVTAAALTPDTPQGSMDQLFQKQTNTSKVLSPSLSGYLWHSLKRGILSITDFVKLRMFRQSPRRVRWQREIRDTTRYEPPSTTTRTATKLVKKLPSLTTGVSNSLAATLRKIKNIFSKKESAIMTPTQTKRTLTERISDMVGGFKRLSRLSKVLLAASVVVAFLLSQSIYSMASSQHTNQESKNTDQTIATINQDITQAEAALTYDNEEGAKRLLATAQNLINTLPNRTKDDKAIITELQNSLNVQLEKTKHIVLVNTPTVMADLTKTDGTINASTLVILDQTIYSADPTKKTLYSISTDGTTEAIPLTTETTVQYLVPENTKALLILNTANKLDEYTASTKKVSPLTFNFSATDINIAAAAFYESRSAMYFLDIKNNQILRSLKGSSGFGTPTAWIKDSTDVRNAVSLTVDGNIYVLDKDGTTARLTAGQKQAWTLSAIEPSLTKANKIWTSTGTDNLYILDAASKRIIEFTKEGAFLNQYTSPAFTEMKDFTVDPSAKKIYILNGNQILAIDLAA